MSSLLPPAERHLRHIMETRAIRGRFFAPKLFADPAWDILLALYRAELRQRRVTVSSCCSAANVPSTTALRCIKMLCDDGIILRTPDPLDGRRTFLALAREASTAMQGFLDAFADLTADEVFQRDCSVLHQQPLGLSERFQRDRDLQC